MLFTQDLKIYKNGDVMTTLGPVLGQPQSYLNRVFSLHPDRIYLVAA